MSDHGGGYSGGHHGGVAHYGHGGHHGHGAAPSAYSSPPGAVPDNDWGPSPSAGSPRYLDSPYAGWGSRVGAHLLDLLAGWGLLVLAVVAGGMAGSVTNNVAAAGAVTVVLAVAALTWFVRDRYVRAGRTGQSLGKRVTGIWLVGERTGQPVGAAMALVRDLAHVVDGITFYIGYLMPLWDARRQTFADKVMHTVVVRAPITGHPQSGWPVHPGFTPGG